MLSINFPFGRSMATKPIVWRAIIPFLVIVEAYLKGVRSFDAEKAYEMMKKTMMGDERGLKFYKQYGYIPYDKWDESVTITLEYAYDDWCVAQMAKALGKTDDYEFFMKRSEAYKHLFDPETGFMRGKSANGVRLSTRNTPTTARQPITPKETLGNIRGLCHKIRKGLLRLSAEARNLPPIWKNSLPKVLKLREIMFRRTSQGLSGSMLTATNRATILRICLTKLESLIARNTG